MSSPSCFTYDDEQPTPPPPECSKSQKKKGECPEPELSTANMGHTVTGLTLDDYYVTVQQSDNGLRSLEGPEICTGSGKKQVCVTPLPNDPLTSPASVKLDYVEIYNNGLPPVVDDGIFNEDAQFSSELGLLLLPDEEWEQILGDSNYSNDSYYQVADEKLAGSLLALQVDNTSVPTIVLDINQANPDAIRILACSNEVDGEILFNGTNFELDSTSCSLSTQASTYTQVVINEDSLPDLDGSGGTELVTVQSLTTDAVTIDGYQILYGTTLTTGLYQEIIGTSEDAGAILQLSDNDDWTFVQDETYSGLGGIQTGVDDATLSFTFDGTGVSILMQSPDGEVPNGQVSVEISNASICGGLCTDEFDLDTTNISAVDGAVTFAGLPNETYDVTIRTVIDEVDGEQVIIDAIEIFGELQELGSLYDDAQVDANGVSLLTFGPSKAFWTAVKNDTSGNFLNNTNHVSSQLGSSVSFIVSGTEPTEAIVIYDGNPTEASTDVDVCWSSISGTSLAQSCSSVSLDDASATTRVNAPSAGNYSVSITNQASGEPLTIDAIQVIEEGLMTEGIYEEDFSQFDEVSDSAIGNAGNGFAMTINNGNDVTFTFEGIAFSALIVDSSNDFNVCVYAGPEVVGCPSPEINDDHTATGNTISAVSYGGFHNSDGSDNDEWTVVITNNDPSNQLIIDRIDILGNKNDLTIVDGNAYEAGEPQIRYLPFGSWTENTDFKNGTPLNGNRFETMLPGSIAYFEFDDDYASGTAGIEYVRQIQAFVPETEECIKFSKGKCTDTQTVPAMPAFADANVCYGEVGDPSSAVCESFVNGVGGFFQFGDSTSATNCTNDCWGFVEYARDADSDTLTPLDFIRLYDPVSPLNAGVYQENHPNIDDSGSVDEGIEDENANVGFFDRISGTAGESYFYFTFEGTGFSISTFAGPNAEDIELCVIDYTGGAVPTLPADINTAECLRTYNNVQAENGFVTRALQGLHHDAQYMGIMKMNSDGTTAMGLDQVTIFDEQWFTETDLDDATYLNELQGGNLYEINFKTRATDKLAQFLGNWQSVSEEVLVGYENEKKQKGPIFETDEGDRALETGSVALFRTDQANALTLDIELDETGSFQVCAIPMTSSADFEVDLAAGASCQIFTQEGRALSSFIFSNDTDPQVITVQLMTDTWMSLYSVSLFDITSGLGAGLYDDSAPGIVYDMTFESVLDEDMEESNVDWETIGGTTLSEQSLLLIDPEAYEGDFSRKVTANIGQGIKYAVSGTGDGVSLDNDTYYTAIAHVYIDPNTAGGVIMRIVSGTDPITETDGLDLSITERGAWQTIRAEFLTESQYDDVTIQIVATGGQTTFFVDKVTLNTGGQWSTGSAPIGPDICTGKGKKQTCVPGEPLFDAFGNTYRQSLTPGASFTFDFVGTGFEIGLLGGNLTGEVEVCYHPESDANDLNCFTYSQDDGVAPIVEVCTKFKKNTCKKSTTTINNTLGIAGRSIVGLPNDTWTVIVKEKDDGYNLGSLTESRAVGEEVCTSFKKGSCKSTSITTAFTNATIGLDYIRIYEDTDIVTVPTGFFNENAQDGSNNDYLAKYPESNWQSFAGTNSFSNQSYTTPTVGTNISTLTGPAALVQIEVEAGDDSTAVVFQFGGDSSGLAQTYLICVDETNGVMEWDGTEFSLVDSNNCILINGANTIGQVSVTNDDIAVLEDVGTHNIYVTALTSGIFRIDGFQVFDNRVLLAGLHNESLPATILEFGPDAIDSSSTCDPMNAWCLAKTKTVIGEICTKFKKGTCKKSTIGPITTSPYIGSAVITSQSGATANFVAQGTGFSLISDVDEHGLDFRLCYKLESSETSFPAIGSSDEEMALDGFDADDLPILVGEGGILCDNLTTDTDNWDTVMDRPASSGAQYGFSYYGLPLATYEVQIMVTTPQIDITDEDWFTLDAIQVFSDISSLSALQPGLTDDADPDINYEPSLFWSSNATTDTYDNSESTTDNSGAIAQFKAEGNSLVLYQTVGDMTSDVQICLLISNENIHCSVEAERQTRLARQVTTFTQAGEFVTEIVCTKFKNGNCSKTSTQTIQETTTFTPIVFYGLGENTTHTIIMENRVHGEIFNIDALRVID